MLAGQRAGPTAVQGEYSNEMQLEVLSLNNIAPCLVACTRRAGAAADPSRPQEGVSIWVWRQWGVLQAVRQQEQVCRATG